MEVTINGETLKFNVESWWGPMYIYETVMDIEHYPERRFNPLRTLHLHVMLWCILLNENPNMTLQLEEFIKVLDDMDLYSQLLECYNKRVAILLDMQPLPSDEEKTAKKKNSRHTKPMSA
jgi:hypothetical protein